MFLGASFSIFFLATIAVCRSACFSLAKLWKISRRHFFRTCASVGGDSVVHGVPATGPRMTRFPRSVGFPSAHCQHDRTANAHRRTLKRIWTDAALKKKRGRHIKTDQVDERPAGMKRFKNQYVNYLQCTMSGTSVRIIHRDFSHARYPSSTKERCRNSGQPKKKESKISRFNAPSGALFIEKHSDALYRCAHDEFIFCAAFPSTAHYWHPHMLLCILPALILI